MSLWFQHDHDIDEKPEFLRIKRASGLDKLLVRGALSAWFEQVNKHGEFLQDGTDRGVMRGYSLLDLVDLIGLTVDFWQIVAAEGWIEESDDGLIVPKFAERFGKLAAKQKRGDPAQPKRPRGRPRKVPIPVEDPLEGGLDPLNRGADSQKGGLDPQKGGVVPQNAGIVSQNDSSPESRENITPTAGSITPPRPTATQQASQFDRLTTADLSVCGTLLTWISDCATKPRPLVVDDEFHQVRVIAAGIRATGPNVREPMALFKSIVGKRRWTMLEPADIERAKSKLRTFRQLQANRQEAYRERAGPVQPRAEPVTSLIPAGFMDVPVDRQDTRNEQADRLRRWRPEAAKAG